MRAAALALFLIACSSPSEPALAVDALEAVVPFDEAHDAAPEAAAAPVVLCEVPDGGGCFDGGTRGKAYRAECSGSWIAERCQLTGDVYCCAWW